MQISCQGSPHASVNAEEVLIKIKIKVSNIKHVHVHVYIHVYRYMYVYVYMCWKFVQVIVYSEMHMLMIH